jgi:hypothetical protein
MQIKDAYYISLAVSFVGLIYVLLVEFKIIGGGSWASGMNNFVYSMWVCGFLILLALFWLIYGIVVHEYWLILPQLGITIVAVGFFFD